MMSHPAGSSVEVPMAVDEGWAGILQSRHHPNTDLAGRNRANSGEPEPPHGNRTVEQKLHQIIDRLAIPGKEEELAARLLAWNAAAIAIVVSEAQNNNNNNNGNRRATEAPITQAS